MCHFFLLSAYGASERKYGIYKLSIGCNVIENRIGHKFSLSTSCVLPSIEHTLNADNKNSHYNLMDLKTNERTNERKKKNCLHLADAAAANIDFIYSI